MRSMATLSGSITVTYELRTSVLDRTVIAMLFYSQNSIIFFAI